METTRQERRPRRAGAGALAGQEFWGRHDLATPLAAARAARARYGWPLEVVEGAGDDPPIERPAAFLAALRRALGDAE
jgi:pimeloyl-ACP methyl ester carboxylesterase